MITNPQRLIIAYAIPTIMLTVVFFALHYTGNLLPHAHVNWLIKEAFTRENLIRNPYPFDIFGPRSVRSLIGQDQFSECQTWNSILATPSRRIEDAIVPKALTDGGTNYCDTLYRIAVLGAQPKTVVLKTRYWWGWKAIAATVLHWGKLDLFQLNIGIKLVAFFAWAALSMIALSHSRRVFLVVFPVVVFGMFFSGIPYYGGISYSLNYLFAITALALLIALLKYLASRMTLYIYAYSAGMVAAYLYFLDGHLLLFLPGAVIILFFGRTDSASFRAWGIDTARFLISFAAGFIVSYAIGVGAKAFYLGASPVWASFADELVHRMSEAKLAEGGVESYLDIFRALFKDGFRTVSLFGNTGLYHVTVYSSIMALCGALVAGFYRKIAQKDGGALLDIAAILIADLLFVGRIVAFPNHSSIHIWFIGRYMFVPLALCWSALAISLMQAPAQNLGKDGLRLTSRT